MHKNYKLAKLLVILGVSFILFGIITKLSNKEVQKIDKNRYKDIDFETKYINNCIEENNCSFPITEFRFIQTTNNNKTLKNKFEEINRKTLKLYNKSINSTTNTTECSSVSNIYKHQLFYQNLFHVYEGENIISVAVNRLEIDLCTNKNNYLGVEVYYFDLKNNKFLTQDDILSKYPIKNIDKAIQEDIKQENNELDMQYKYENVDSNYKIYFDSEGFAFVYYKHREDESYSDAMLDFQIKNNN